jgi:hypothetical protein
MFDFEEPHTIDPKDKRILELQWENGILRSEIEMFKNMIDVMKTKE